VFDNGKPPLLMSEQPHPVHFEPGDRKSVVCPTCRTMRFVKQNLIVRHDALDGLADCPDSFRRVVFDVSAQQAQVLSAVRAAGLAAARRQAATRRGTRTQLKPAAPIPAALAHIKRDRTPTRAQIGGWSRAETDSW
jgi:hypothetical protein